MLIKYIPTLEEDMHFPFYIMFIFLSLSMICCESHAFKPKISAENFQAINWSAFLSKSNAPIYKYRIVKTYPHDVDTFTEGLEMNEGYLYESNGLYKKSHLRRIEKNTGKVLLEHQLLPQYFAEGITLFNNKIYQLTYQTNTGFIYNKDNLNLEKTFQIPSPGWGLTHDDHELIMSNGTSALIFLNPNTLIASRYIIVHDEEQHIPNLNALSYINGKIYANVFDTQLIAIISPLNGSVEGWINLNGLMPQENLLNPDCIKTRCLLNGIAYDSKEKELLVTGKNWPYIYAIEVLR